MKLPERKRLEYGKHEFDDVYVLNVMRPHNVDTYPNALFLKTWAIKYHNEALKTIL